MGNRTASHQGSSYSYQTFNRLITANSSSFSYNANGNLASKTDASGSWTYAWDYENRLKQASEIGGVTVTYSYDALGRRIQRTSSSGATTKFVYDGADVLRDLDASGLTVADYLNGPGIDNKLRQTTGGTPSYFIQDHLASTRALADASGYVTANLVYDSFGNLTSGSASTLYTYTGREMDSDVGLIYYRARWYDSQLGRFISEDPIGLYAGINLYSYVTNNPLGFRDPWGLCRQKSNDPCDSIPDVERDLRTIASGIGARLGDKWRVEDLHNPYDRVLEDLKREGFEPFTNINPPHWGGADFQGQVNNRWYHVTVSYPYSRQDRLSRGGIYRTHVFNPNKPPPRVDIHCERWKPSSADHLIDWFIRLYM